MPPTSFISSPRSLVPRYAGLASAYWLQFLALVDRDDFGRCDAGDEDMQEGLTDRGLTRTGMVMLGVVEMCPFGSALRSTR